MGVRRAVTVSERSVGWLHVPPRRGVAVVAGEPLIVGANRDEVLERPSTAVTVLDEGPPRMLGGRDKLSGGTWLAVNEYGVCAGLTNQPLGDAKDPSKRSRGALPLELARHATAAEAVDALLSAFRPADYNGSWLLVGDHTSLFFVDFTGRARRRRSPLPPWDPRAREPGLGETSPKVDLVRAGLDVDARRRRGGGRLPPRPGRPSEPRGRGAARTRPTACTSRRSGHGRPASCGSLRQRRPRMWVADGPPCTTAYEDVSGLWELRPVPERPEPSVADERLVAQAVRLVGVDAETLVAVGLVVAEVALPPSGFGLPLEGEHVGGDAVEEPAVVADDHGAAGEGQQRVLEARNVSTSRSLVGSSSRRTLPPLRSTLASSTRLRSPPESWPTFFCWSLPLKPKPAT